MDDLAVAARANMVTHVSWVPRRVPGMVVADEHGLVLVDSGLPCDTFNVICAAQLEPDVAPLRVREALAHFGTVGRPFSWWVGPADRPADLGALLVNAGLVLAEGELAMTTDLLALRDDDSVPAALRIVRAHTVAHLRDFAQVLAASWTPPDPDVLRFYALAAPILLAPDAPLWLYVGYLGDVSVATAELTIGGGVVGLYNISTLVRYRQRGFGRALTLRPLLDAREGGYRQAVLQAAAAGVNIYIRAGFVPFGTIAEYKPV